MPKIYQFKAWDIRAGTYRVSRKMSTAKSIRKAHGVIIEGTEAEVDDAMVDSEGMTRRDFVPRRVRHHTSELSSALGGSHVDLVTPTETKKPRRSAR
jgi:hypothetical protein